MWKVTNVKAQTTMKAKGVLANARSEVPQPNKSLHWNAANWSADCDRYRRRVRSLRSVLPLHRSILGNAPYSFIEVDKSR